MERYAWKAIVKDGMLEEYKRRHDAIWPELKALLKEAGIGNYTIWNVGTSCSDTMSAKRAATTPQKRRRRAPSSTNGTNT